MISAGEALRRLKEGNQRFMSGRGGRDLDFEHVRRLETVGDQAPFAIVLGCSDSRVPLELIFDQGLGDLFVIRVAGNIALSSQLGSIEFAAAEFGTPLLVVLGHSGCGAVAAAVDGVLGPARALSPNLDRVVGRIRPAVEAQLEKEPGLDRDSLLNASVGGNVRRVAGGLEKGSEVLGTRIRDGRLKVVGAEYSLENGGVLFFD